MFDRFIRMQLARKALREQRFEDALRLASDPEIRSHRKVADILGCARLALIERARARLSGGEWKAAQRLHELLLSFGADERVHSLGAEIEERRKVAEADADVAREALDRARELVAEGELDVAEAAIGAVPAGVDESGFARLRAEIAERRRRAAEARSACEAHLRRGDLTAAIAGYRASMGQDRAIAGDVDLRSRLVEALLARLDRAVSDALRRGDLPGALGAWRDGIPAELELEVDDDRLAGVRGSIGAAVWDVLRRATEFGVARELARQVARAGFPAEGALRALLDALHRCGQAAVPVEPSALRDLRAAAAEAGAEPLAEAARGLLRRAEARAEAIAAAREEADAGDLDSAREKLAALLAGEPGDAVARRELERIEGGYAGLRARLDEAKEAARGGRLEKACAEALALGTRGRIGADAQLLLTDVRARMALVDRGLEEILASLHGRAAGSLQGVRHCKARLDELAKIQSDHERLEAVRVAVGSEIACLEALERCRLALESGRIEAVGNEIGTILEGRGKLLQPERLDARLLAIGDALFARADRALSAGQARVFDASLQALAPLGVVDAALEGRVHALREEASGRRAAAEEKVLAANEALSRRDLAEAEALHEEACRQWAGAPGIERLAEKLGRLRHQSDALDRVAALAEERDVHGAAERLADLPPTPPMLRTRIFDIKQRLARAQGLEGGFLLRVDEGGEHLVLRGETISIGNVRQGRADLPVLANIAGLHATIRRSMSFHGGMEDVVVAEDGEVWVDEQPVEKRRLTAGARIRFGRSLVVLYEQPTRRSLTVGLLLQRGFQVSGTESVLLMKDRGKDGRILLGPSRDVHVRVPSATGEVELFATANGQMRVGCEAGGEIDGAPFRGEHPVDAGQLVRAGGITFTLLPYRSRS